MNVIFIEPSFPSYQRQFARGLAQAGANVIGIGEAPKDYLSDDLKHYLTHYEQVSSVVDEDALLRTVRWLQDKLFIDRMETTVEAHVMSVARVREAAGIEGTSVRTAYLCRDKTAMKEVLREAGVPCAQSTGAATADEIREFAERVGYPLILKPPAAAGAAGTHRVDNSGELEQLIPSLGPGSIAVEEYVEGHEAFYDTITINGRVAQEFISHYFPNVLEAMRTRWISPQFVSTNRVDSAPAYDQVKEMGRKVIEALGIETSATHMEWFFGPKGLMFSEIGCRPPGVGAWDLYAAGNDFDIYREWAEAVVYRRTTQEPSRRFSSGIIALRPDRDGHIAGYDGIQEVHRAFNEWVIDSHLPPAGTPTQPVEAGYMANAWIRMRHPDYDELRRMLDAVGQKVQVRAA